MKKKKGDGVHFYFAVGVKEDVFVVNDDNIKKNVNILIMKWNH